MINRGILEKHAQLAADLWPHRKRAERASNYTAKDLAALDARIEANLAGLLIAGPSGLDAAMGMLDPASPEGVFVIAHLTYRLGSPLETVLGQALSDSKLVPAVVDALSFLAWPDVEGLVNLWQRSQKMELRAVAIDVAVAHGRDPVGAFENLTLQHVQYARAATRAVALLGLSHRLNPFYPLLDSELPELRVEAALAVLRLGTERELALSVLDRAAAASKTPCADLALTLSVRARDNGASDYYTAIRGQLSSHARHLAAAAVGTRAMVDELVAECFDPESAPTAASATALITGVDFAYADLVGPAPTEVGESASGDTQDSEDGSQATGLDAAPHLVWPAPERVVEWWKRERSRFGDNDRYLAGHPITLQGLRWVLAQGSQQARYEASWELGLREPGPIHNTAFPVLQRRSPS